MFDRTHSEPFYSFVVFFFFFSPYTLIHDGYDLMEEDRRCLKRLLEAVLLWVMAFQDWKRNENDS
jgi:hypothetical protein